MTKAADDFESIRRRLEELKAEKQEALTGSSAPMSEEPKDVESVYGYGALDYSAWRKDYGLSSMAHPEWPYAGTAHEWRGFVPQFTGVATGGTSVPINIFDRLPPYTPSKVNG